MTKGKAPILAGTAAVALAALLTAGCSSRQAPGLSRRDHSGPGLRPGRSELAERTVDLTYSFAIRDVPADAAEAIAWVPIPPSNGKQKLKSLRVDGGRRADILTEAEYGNRFLRFDLSADVRGGRDPHVAVAFRVARRACRPLEHGPCKEGPTAPLRRFLEPDRLVPIDGRIAWEAKRVAGDAETPLERSRLLYDHIVDSLSYDKTGERWGRGDAVYACDIRKGNCTDFHSLFIGEARSIGIPARFIMGVSLPPNTTEGAISGYHCWTEFYVEGRGWLPVDASEASKDNSRREELFGGLDENRAEFTLGRDIRIPGAASGPLNYVIYPHVEVDGRTHKSVRFALSFRDLDGDRLAAVRR